MGELSIEEYNKIIKQEEACLFPKSYVCPICDEHFKSLTVRSSKLYSQGMDEDLRPKFRWVDPIKYEVVVCPICGYGALSRYFNEMIPVWRKMLQNGMPSFNNERVFLGGNRLSYDESLKLYEFACRCNELAAFKGSRKAYTYLKRGWVVRGKLYAESDFLKPEEKEGLKIEETRCLELAYDGFMKAISEEDFPIAGMDEDTLMYLCSALANRLEKYADAMTLLSRLMASRTVNPRVKDKAFDLKEIVRERLKEQEANGQ
ncbi:MAG: DUF2225 domain-containing protein [Lachnospiraceae bacterium]|nr:DUF2225 domain-containing protein [Lachnospiraceae bacterium]